jgi:hypothetical protein
MGQPLVTWLKRKSQMMSQVRNIRNESGAIAPSLRNQKDDKTVL